MSPTAMGLIPPDGIGLGTATRRAEVNSFINSSEHPPLYITLQKEPIAVTRILRPGDLSMSLRWEDHQPDGPPLDPGGKVLIASSIDDTEKSKVPGTKSTNACGPSGCSSFLFQRPYPVLIHLKPRDVRLCLMPYHAPPVR